MSKIFRAYLLEQYHGGSKKTSVWIKWAQVSENGEILDQYSVSLCEFLEGDIQTEQACSHNIDQVVKVLKGEREHYSWSGNAFTVTSDKCRTAFYNDSTEENKGTIPTYEYLSALLFWKKFILDTACFLEQRLPSSDEEAIKLLSDFFD